MKKIPSLDGLRAVSILMVVLLHSLQRVSMHRPVSHFYFIFGNGGMGVYIFFVISGYLITTLLLREHGKYGTISLRDFYLRRAFRILPPIYFYIAVLLVVSHYVDLNVSLDNARGALFFYSNYSERPWALDHFWSLGIEEQFYFVWPLTLLWALRGNGRRAAAYLALAVIVICPLIRMATYEFGGVYARQHNGYSFQGRADALMFGCLVALLAGSRRFEQLYGYAARGWWLFPIVLIFVSGTLELRFGNYWDFPVGYTLNGICISLFLLWCVRNPESRVGKVLNTRIARSIGVLSYSIYIWQQLFLNPHSPNFPNSFQFFNTILGRYILVACASSFSYFLVERPALRIRDVMERKLGLKRARQAHSTVAS